MRVVEQTPKKWEKIFFYELKKIMKIKKINQKEKETINDIPYVFSFSCLLL